MQVLAQVMGHGWGIEPHKVCVSPALWHVKAGASGHERVVKVGLGIQKP